jgi:hypothetical protein
MTVQKQTLNLNLRLWIAQDVLFELALEGLRNNAVALSRSPFRTGTTLPA